MQIEKKPHHNQCLAYKKNLYVYFTYRYFWILMRSEGRGIRSSWKGKWEAKHLIDSVRKLSDRLPDYCPGKAGLTDGTLTAALCPNTIPSLHSSNLHSSSLITPTCQFLSSLSPLRPPDLVFSRVQLNGFLFLFFWQKTLLCLNNTCFSQIE